MRSQHERDSKNKKFIKDEQKDQELLPEGGLNQEPVEEKGQK